MMPLIFIVGCTTALFINDALMARQILHDGWAMYWICAIVSLIFFAYLAFVGYAMPKYGTNFFAGVLFTVSIVVYIDLIFRSVFFAKTSVRNGKNYHIKKNN